MMLAPTTRPNPARGWAGADMEMLLVEFQVDVPDDARVGQARRPCGVVLRRRRRSRAGDPCRIEWTANPRPGSRPQPDLMCGASPHPGGPLCAPEPWAP